MIVKLIRNYNSEQWKLFMEPVRAQGMVSCPSLGGIDLTLDHMNHTIAIVKAYPELYSHKYESTDDYEMYTIISKYILNGSLISKES